MIRLFRYRFGKREGLILQKDQGWGEIAPLPGFSQETLEEAQREIVSILPHFDTAEPKLPSVRFGCTLASTPLSLAPLTTPLAALNIPKPGCTTLKLKLGSLTIEEAVAKTKTYLGTYRLRLDCNRGWSLQEALFFASHFSPADFEYLEEPVAPFSDLIRFSKLTQFPIAADESFRDSSFLDIPTLKAVICKPTLMGTIPKPPPHIPLILSSSFESSLGILQIARLASSELPQGLGTFQDDLLTPPLQVADGHLIWKGTSTHQPIDTSKLCLIASVP